MREPLPPDFDWVTARHECSADKMFHQLRLLALSNVETRNAQAPDSVGFTATHDGSFSVWNKRGSERKAVDFTLMRQTMTVSNGDPFSVTVTLNNQGVCKCRVGDEELDPWQLLKKALEPVLFSG